ncbi:MAG: hypothetical protein ACJAR2_000979 [Ilumatobacter sp.]|jgi:hypothetical protein
MPRNMHEAARGWREVVTRRRPPRPHSPIRENLLPIGVHHHHKIHDAGGNITLGNQRQSTVTSPDGTVMTNGPSARRAERA